MLPEPFASICYRFIYDMHSILGWVTVCVVNHLGITIHNSQFNVSSLRGKQSKYQSA